MKKATTQSSCPDNTTSSKRTNNTKVTMATWLMVVVLATMLSAAFAQSCGRNMPAVLNLRSNEKWNMKVFINGRDAGPSAPVIKLDNVPAGKVYVQVYRVELCHGYETMDNAYRGFLDIQPGTEVFATINDRYQALNVDRIAMLGGHPGMGQPGYFRDHPRAWDNNRYVPVVNEPLVCGPVAISPRDFAALRQTIANANFESTRLNIFKQALFGNYFTASQVSDLMSLFCFESYKLEVAKLAYPKTIDQQNYYMVNNGFNFSSSVHQLGEYIAMR